MTTLALIAAFAATFVIGFLVGDRRGVRQCNGILDDHWRELMLSIREERGLPAEPENEEERATIH